MFVCLFRVDSMIALQILAEAAKSSLMAMKALHNLARGFRPVDSSETSPEPSRSPSSGEDSSKTNVTSLAVTYIYLYIHVVIH